MLKKLIPNIPCEIRQILVPSTFLTLPPNPEIYPLTLSKAFCLNVNRHVITSYSITCYRVRKIVHFVLDNEKKKVFFFRKTSCSKTYHHFSRFSKKHVLPHHPSFSSTKSTPSRRAVGVVEMTVGQVYPTAFSLNS